MKKELKYKTPEEILNESRTIVLEDSLVCDGFIVSFYNEQDEELIDIIVNNNQLDYLIQFILDNNENISIYKKDLSNLIIPSRQKLYEDIYL